MRGINLIVHTIMSSRHDVLNVFQVIQQAGDIRRRMTQRRTLVCWDDSYPLSRVFLHYTGNQTTSGKSKRCHSRVNPNASNKRTLADAGSSSCPSGSSLGSIRKLYLFPTCSNTKFSTTARFLNSAGKINRQHQQFCVPVEMRVCQSAGPQ